MIHDKKLWMMTVVIAAVIVISSIGISSAATGRSSGSDYFGYTFKDSNVEGGPTYDWIEISNTGTMILPDSDDYYVENIPVGFFFNYYGTDYSQVSITNNGITLASGGTGEYSNQPIGSSTPHNFIAPFWDDIVTWGSAGAVYYQVIGEAPNRKFIVEWFDNQGYSNTPSGATFEAILYEGTNNIKFQYKDADFGSDSYNNGTSATVGIEGADGAGLQYSYNEPVLSPNLAILFKFPAFSGTNMYISKNAPASKDHGSLMTYTLYYNNFGNTTASGVVLQDTIPSNVEFESASDNGTYDSATGKVTWDVGSVSPLQRGSRTVSVRIPDSVSVGTVIQNTASISTTTLETRYDDNSARASTTVTGSNLPPDVGVEPNNGGSGTTSIYWMNPITFSYDSCSTATGVDIRIHIDDGGSDITGSMTGGPSHWTYTTEPFYPRHGEATITYTVYGCTQSTVSFNIYIDPAGYIYDIDTGERISGASVWLQRPDGAGDWENVPTGESVPVAQPDVNPQVTGADGMYQWDVLAGSYRVHVEAPGYEPANSIVVSIPPPVFDLHVGLHRTSDPVPPSSITNLQSTNGTNWINWTWTNPRDTDLNHTEVYLNNVFQTNTSAEYFNATGLQPETDYTISTRTVDRSGNVNETWVNSTATTDKIPVPPVANFISNVTEGYAPLDVQFTDKSSEEPTSWSWDFGDGTTSDIQSPAHTYAKAGDYTVKLTVTNTAGTDTVEESDYITVKPGQDPTKPVANFTAAPASGDKPLKVKFTDTSTGNINSWYWDFGDGVRSTTKNPSHTYKEYRSYTVSLRVMNTSTGLQNTTIKPQYINVTAPLVANFSATPKTGNAPLAVQFTDASTSATAWNWDFGDGATSTEKNPKHTYTAAGSYTVKLTASNAAGMDTIEEPDYIQVGSGAGFTASPTSGNAPLKVTFTDKSSGKPTSWLWNFGDGTRSTSKNAEHTYTKPGSYSSTLTVTYPDGSKSTSQAVQINVTQLPVADFSFTPSTGYAPLLVQFTDKSASATSWKWDFGDGATSTKQNPAHTFSKAGTYTVTLKAINANGEASKVATVNVIPPTLPVADFSFTPSTGLVPLDVQFTDTSTGEPTSWKWNFGDGATSTEQNPKHTYSSGGQYTVSLTVTNSFGTDTVEDYVTVEDSVKLVAAFSATPTSGNMPLKVTFTDKSTGNPTSWEWTFGDGTRSKSKNAVHTYSKAGTYTAKLTVKDAKGATASTSTKITVLKVIKPSADFSASPTSGKAPLTVAFTDKSKNTPTKWQWTFGDGKTSTEQNPTHKYTKAGTYKVKLIATNSAGSSGVTKYGYIVVS